MKRKPEVEEYCREGYNNNGPDVSLGSPFAKLVSAIILVSAFEYKVGPFQGD
jgi:hypothetical protein